MTNSRSLRYEVLSSRSLSWVRGLRSWEDGGRPGINGSRTWAGQS